MFINKHIVNCIFLLLSQIAVFSPQPNIKLEVVGNVSDYPKWSFFAPHENENVANKYVSEQIIKNDVLIQKIIFRSVWIDLNANSVLCF